MKIRYLHSKIAHLLCLVISLSLIPASARAADHGDSPLASNNASADLGDLYFYLDPNDNSKVVLAMTVRGFITPGEAVNMGIFDPNLVYHFGIESTGDATPDGGIDVTFTPRTSTASGQVATVRMMNGTTKVFEFSAPATAPSLKATAPTQVVTTDATSGVSFFAGEVDDPFFFDIPAFSRFVASVLAGAPDGTVFSRARDTFAGYNIMTIALSMPKTMLPSTNNVVGLNATTSRSEQRPITLFGNLSTRGRVEAGDGALIGGLIVTGDSLKRILIRGVGPSLTANGVSGALADPTMTIYNSTGQAVVSNDNWQDTQSAEITSTGLAPKDTKESAVIATLAPGAYTVVVTGVGGGTGIALVEAYDLDTGSAAAEGGLRQLDRVGIPAVNVALIPFARKDEYNGASTPQDAAGRFAGDIVGTLKALGTNAANIAILADVAVNHGDFLRLDLTKANTGAGGGNNASAAFPNGRRLGDDVIDTLLAIITNGGLTTGDGVNANDVPLRDTFPFFALSQQPRDTGVIDDNTRN